MSQNEGVFGSGSNVPHRLRERADQLLKAGIVDAPHDLIGAAIVAVGSAMGAGPGDRTAALEVLVADALITHAMGLMVADPEMFEAGCEAAVQRLAAIVDAQ